MNIIVLVKQVPDISHIPEEAWDHEKGTLKRGVLDTVFNPLDLQALTFACQMRDTHSLSGKGRVVALTMGPNQAREMLEDCLSRGADEAVLLTDMKFAGADTPATAYALAQAVRKIGQEILNDNSYVLISGMQSVDGDTAQVPPQVAEALDIEHIAYARSFRFDPQGTLLVDRIGPKGIETVQPTHYPVLITTTNCVLPVNRSFHRLRSACVAGAAKLHIWGADAIRADEDKTGFKGSRTWVYRIFSSVHQRAKPCEYPKAMEDLLDRLERDYKRGPRKAVEARAPYVLGDRTPSYQGEVWVFAEQENGVLADVSRELLGKAKELGRSLKEKVAAVLVGDNVQGLTQDLFAAGADKVYLAEHGLLKDFLPFPYKKTVAAMVLRYRPQIVLFGATPLGRELAPRIAYATGAGLTADCTGLEIDDHIKGDEVLVAILKQTRPALGGNIMATIMTKDSPFQMATVRPGVFKALSPALSGKGEIVRFEPALEDKDLRSRIILSKPALEKAHLEEADIIVCGGRGMGSRADFEKYLPPLAQALARWLKCQVEVAGSRMAVEDGFIGHERQVGQTGQTVAPKLYIAIAVSGAVQHITGMQNAGVVLALNKDPHARIYNYSDYGIVADFEDAVPELIEAIQRRAS
jgi:electron transfer flavoprotein alpha subunit